MYLYSIGITHTQSPIIRRAPRQTRGHNVVLCSLYTLHPKYINVVKTLTLDLERV